MTHDHPILRRHCPACGAKPGDGCKDESGNPASFFHGARFRGREATILLEVRRRYRTSLYIAYALFRRRRLLITCALRWHPTARVKVRTMLKASSYPNWHALAQRRPLARQAHANWDMTM